MPFSSTNSGRTWIRATLWLGLLVLLGCPKPVAETEAPLLPSDHPLLAATLPEEDRLRLILEAGQKGEQTAVPALLRLMRDRSQAAFLLVSDPAHELGYQAVELEETGPDTQHLRRVAAIAALEAAGGTLPILDFVLALQDRHPVVVNHAARALIRLGSRAGLPALLAHHEGRNWPKGEPIRSPAFAGETAKRILVGITGKSFGYSADAGHERKLAAAAGWRAHLASVSGGGSSFPLAGRPYPNGQKPATDRRLAFFVDMLGQMQTLYHEQVRLALTRLGAPILPHHEEGIRIGLEKKRETLLGGVAQVLGAIPHPNARALLERIMKDGPGAARSRATLAMGEHGGAASIDALLSRLQDADPSVIASAVRALGRTRDARAEAAISALTPAADSELALARTLALFESASGRKLADEVLRLLTEGSIVERNGAAEVLTRVTGQRWLTDPVANEVERRAAADRWRAALPK